jgi:RimJ/RimL family protein N-acetyltransferase
VNKKSPTPVLRGDTVSIFPLKRDDLMDWLDDPEAVSRRLGLRFVLARPNRLLRSVLQRKAESISARPDRELWITYWGIVPRSEPDLVVGLVGFKGLDTRNRLAEVGYGIEPEYRGRGFMKAALRLLLQWAAETGRVSGIVALTDDSNEPSIRVLRACGFAVESREGHQIRWVRPLPSTGSTKAG